VQTRTLDLIRSLANERLIDIGDLAGRDARFTPWESPLDASIDRLRKVYVEDFDATAVDRHHLSTLFLKLVR